MSGSAKQLGVGRHGTRLVVAFGIAFGCVSSGVLSAAPPDKYREARARMVDQDIAREGVKNKLVLASMREVPRHLFVDSTQRQFAYFDQSLPIGKGQTISPPFIVAYMTETLDPQPNEKVLEIGTGSGYQAAVLSGLVKEVYTIEIVEQLGKSAEKRLKDLGYKNVHCRVGDGYKGWPEHAPFDKVIVTCSPESVPQALVDQLRDGGKMLIPLGERYDQMFYMFEKKGSELVKSRLIPALFVPMTGASEQQRKVKPDPRHPTLHNGDFELVADGFFEGWFYQRQSSVGEDQTAPHGKRYLHMENKEEGRGAQVLQGMGVDGNHVSALKISLHIRGKDLKVGSRSHEKPGVMVHFFDSNRKPMSKEALGPWQGTFDWKEVSETIHVPPTAREAIIRFGINGGTGSLDIDDIRMTSEPR